MHSLCYLGKTSSLTHETPPYIGAFAWIGVISACDSQFGTKGGEIRKNGGEKPLCILFWI